MKKIKIGRDSTQSFVIDDTSVSREHAVIEIENDNISIADNNSSNGTYVLLSGDRIPVEGSVAIDQSTELFFGDAGPYHVKEIVAECKDEAEISKHDTEGGAHTEAGIQKTKCLDCGAVIRFDLSVCPQCGGSPQ